MTRVGRDVTRWCQLVKASIGRASSQEDFFCFQVLREIEIDVFRMWLSYSSVGSSFNLLFSQSVTDDCCSSFFVYTTWFLGNLP